MSANSSNAAIHPFAGTLCVPHARAFTIRDLLFTLIALAALSSMLAAVSHTIIIDSQLGRSLRNLSVLNLAHQQYAADYNGRQVTVIPDDITQYGDLDIVAFANYAALNGQPNLSLGLGYDCDFTVYWYCQPPETTVVPLNFEAGSGYCRTPNADPFQQYLHGKFFDPVFYGPNDRAVYPVVQPWLSQDCGFPGLQLDAMYYSSYCWSPAAWQDPQVFRAPSQGGYQDAFTLPFGLRTPNIDQARYPNLKTQLMEHNWNQNEPADPCNPIYAGLGTYNGCEPYYFNLGLASQPATLFYDGHVALLPVAQVIADDARVLKGTAGVDGFWPRDTPLGPDGYFGNAALDDIRVSHHILTTNGILGRDCLSSN